MATRKTFHDSVERLPEPPARTSKGLVIHRASPKHLAEHMGILFSLEAPKAVANRLEALVADGRTVTVEELHRDFAVESAESDRLVNWLEDQGFEVLRVSKDHASVFARARASQIEKSLDVEMVRVTKAGLTYTAGRNAPSLPATIARAVHAIIGLQPFRHAHKHARRFVPLDDQPAPAAAGTGPVVEATPPYRVAQILKAYDAEALTVTGREQTIAILIDTLPNDSDLVAFWSANGVSGDLDRIVKIDVGRGTLPPPEGEETLDVSWASGIAPGARVRVYAAGSLQFSALDRAMDQIVADAATHPQMRQLSLSYGTGETYVRPGEVRAQHGKYLKLAALGINIFASSGDAGAHPDASGHHSGGPLQVEYAASDPCIVAVGGTTLAYDDAGTRSETAWSGSGGGRSQYKFFKRPKWQKGLGVPAGTTRLVPDVSVAADPMGGAYLVFNGNVLQYGGTSWSAPVWAGFCALINEARAVAKLPPLGFLNPRLYPLLGTSAFRDIVEGSNGGYDAGPGYDMVTGLGVPNVRELIRALTTPRPAAAKDSVK